MLFRKNLLQSTTAMTMLLAAGAAQAQNALPPVAIDVAPADAGLEQPLDGSYLDKKALQSKIPSARETADLLDGLPGVSLYTGGGVSSLPSLRGLNDDRINTLVDGVPVMAACPNHMNPVLSYVQPGSVEAVQVLAGITPVSKGGDSIAGTIEVQTAAPVFAGAGQVLAQGSLSTFFKSVNRSISLGGNGVIANDTFSLSYAGSGTDAHDYKDGNGDRIAASSYKGQNHTVKIATQGDHSLAELEVGGQVVPIEGFPNQFMDLMGNNSRFVKSHYNSDQSWGALDVRAYWRNVDHDMNFLSDRNPSMAMPMDTRETEAGYTVKAEIPLAANNGTLRMGNEFHYDILSDYWPGYSSMMGPNTYINLNAATRNRVGNYVEWETKPTTQWTTLLGARSDVVMMNAGDVQPYNGMTAATNTEKTNFNALNRARTDYNFDGTALARYDANANTTEEFGIAHKTRSPNVYERYTWHETDMVSWFGDGNGYRGSVSLRPEQANIISFTQDWHDSTKTQWDYKVTPYYNYIHDYIGVNYISAITGMSTDGGNYLQFANHDAMVYGVDLAGSQTLVANSSAGTFKLSETGSLQHGYTINDGNSLYHMMPVNMALSLTQNWGHWTNVVEVKAIAGKSEANALMKERYTPGSGVVNLRTAYEWSNLRLDAGIDNLLNQQYYSPLGGVDLADWKANGSNGTPSALASPGRSYNAGVTVKF